MDPELVTYLDRRFAELRQDIGGDIAASAAETRRELRAEMAASAAETRQELRAEMAASAAETRQELRAEMAASAERLRAGISAETARHIDTVVEDLISKIALVVEGVRTVDQRLDRFSDEVRDELQKVDRRLLRLHARLGGRGRRRPGH